MLYKDFLSFPFKPYVLRVKGVGSTFVCILFTKTMIITVIFEGNSSCVAVVVVVEIAVPSPSHVPVFVALWFA